MKKHLFIPVIAAMALAITACSNDEPQSVVVNKADAISFSAVVPNGSRAASTTTSTIKDFVVYAFTEGDTLMNGVTVKRSGNSWTYSPEAYWPVSPVNFYAFSPDITNSTSIKGINQTNTIPDYLNPGNVDLLYSVKTKVSQQAAPVLLNFRHALSKVSVMMSSTNQRISVKVHHISLCNIYLQGTFTFPEGSTLASTPDVVGSWSKYKNLNKSLLFYAMAAGDEVTLTTQPTDYTENNLEYSFLLPQPLSETQLVDSDYTGTFIQVDCEIFDTATGVKLWPNSHTPSYMLIPSSETGRIVYPTTSDNVKAWEPGHAYIYNIAINNPDVLDKIEFDVTVDDFNIDEM
ncbi:MAG: fimbrillin family protein [Clostridiales bacterium]|nr:fimbrillin family protein [Clostridiales bacterium]